MATRDETPLDASDLLPLALTGYGHFTSMRVEAGDTIRGLTLHMERLERDCEAVYGAELDTARVRERVRAALASHEARPCVVRVTVHDPKVQLGRPVEADDPRILVTVRPAGRMPSTPLRVRSVPYERDLPRVKHCGLFGALHARRAAQLAGGDDALFVGRDGHVSEGVTWNAAFVVDGAVVWPRAPVLPGVTMALLQRHTAGIEHRTATLTLAQARAAEAAFGTNTSIGVRALAGIDGHELPAEHPVLHALRESYLSLPGEPL